MRKDERGYFYFVDRVGDTFRWKGENVSTSEVSRGDQHLPRHRGRQCLWRHRGRPRRPRRHGGDRLRGRVRPRGLHAHLCANLPEYARPLFLRIQERDRDDRRPSSRRRSIWCARASIRRRPATRSISTIRKPRASCGSIRRSISGSRAGTSGCDRIRRGGAGVLARCRSRQVVQEGRRVRRRDPRALSCDLRGGGARRACRAGRRRRRRARARHRARSVPAQHVPRQRPRLRGRSARPRRRRPRASSAASIARRRCRSAQFFYLPFEHSETLPDQERCCALFRATGDAEALKWAELHADIIRRFGRFPHRNAVLGRATTPEEQAFLDSGGFAG